MSHRTTVVVIVMDDDDDDDDEMIMDGAEAGPEGAKNNERTIAPLEHVLSSSVEQPISEALMEKS